jgi:hypothetical protein
MYLIGDTWPDLKWAVRITIGLGHEGLNCNTSGFQHKSCDGYKHVIGNLA